jgi:hypothetical protein
VYANKNITQYNAANGMINRNSGIMIAGFFFGLFELKKK